MKVLCLLTTLFVITASAPLDTIGECTTFQGEKRAEKAIKFWKGLSVIKDPSLYNAVEELKSEKDKAEDSLALFLATILSEDLTDEEKLKVLTVLDITTAVEEILEELFKFLKATLPEGANPTEEEVVEMAKRMSLIFQTTDFRFRQFTDKVIMSNATVIALQKIVQENPIKESGNDFLSKFKDVIPRIYNVAKEFKAKKERKELLVNIMNVDRATANNEKDFAQFTSFWFLNEIDAFMHVEENAIALYKNWAALMKTLKNPSSYDSLNSLYDNLSHNQRLEAYAIIVREYGKCLGHSLTAEDKAAFHEHIKYILKVFKAMFADGQKTTEESIAKLVCTEGDHYLELQKIFAKINLDDENNMNAVLSCSFSDSDRAIGRQYMDFTKTIYTKEELNELRAQNEKMYAQIFLINGIAKALQRGHQTSSETDLFLREAITTPHLMARIAKDLNPSQETLDKIKVEKKRMMDKFNGLSNAVKDNLIDMYPYRAVVKLAYLD